MAQRNTTTAVKVKASKELFDDVINVGLCAQCGACAGSCPYLFFYKGRVVLLDNCTVSDGQCYQYCPRTYTDMDALSKQILKAPYRQDEFGSAREVLRTRSTDAGIREKAQNTPIKRVAQFVGGSGTALTLLSLALDEGIIDSAIVSGKPDDKYPRGSLAKSAADILQYAGSNYMCCSILETLNRMPKNSQERLGIITMPCQGLALAKMKTVTPQHRVNIGNVKLTIGLFCIRGIMQTCNYCIDMTSEFADISVGSIESEGWDTVIVRTDAGAKLLETAKARGKLETVPVPDQYVAGLKEVALQKKKGALERIIKRSGDKKKLIYLGLSESLVDKFLG